ncbi:MAG TPA: M28 family peptidase [Candidatus Acidoferrales bacterium]|nr:M28 family peptidase [Candidatus Acidoferrales bacterium]
MRRIHVSVSLMIALSLGALLTMGAAERARDSASKARKAPVAAKYGNADAISEDELRAYDYFLASDQLEGRNFPSRGYDVAALYVASHLGEWGLKPGGSTSGTNGPLQPYFMPIEMVTREVVQAESKASLTARPPFGGGPGELRTTEFEYGKDWSVPPVGGFRGLPAADSFDFSGNLVFAGNGYVINKSNINPYGALDVRGKTIVVAGLPPEIAAEQGPGRRPGTGPNPLGEECKDFLTPEEYAAKNGAAGVVRIANFQQLAAMANSAAASASSPNGPFYQVSKFEVAPACPSVPSVTAGAGLTNALFQGEKADAAEVFYAAGTNAKQNSFALSAEKKISLHVVIQSHPGHGENVIGILEGSDPVLKNEYVVMSAHLDHIGLSLPLPDGHNVNNGADDDGSGSTGLLGIAHAYAEGAAKGIRPKRTIIFLWNGGEEKGLWGSRYFNEFPPIDLSKVVANLNMDMIGRTKSPKSVDPNPTHVLMNSGEVMVVGPNVSSDDLEKTIETVDNNYLKLVLNHFYDATAPDATHDNLGPKPNGQRIFYRSDHYNFAKMGIPIAFFTTGLHVDYHRPTDTPEKIDFQELQRVAKTVAAVGWVLAEQPGRPRLNAKLPDQLIKDMKTVQTDGWGKVTPVLPPLPGEPY